MINPKTLDFLKKLAKNNNRTWFKEHKSEFDAINKDFLEFVEELAQDIARFDKRIADSLHDKSTVKVFRIYKDVRFSKDKSPYKLNLGGTITPYG
ncbi:DUF2461 domain-containing protein, partial [Candidatus Dojkabacteria bacterium]|nr:DUF2461 domain-containing protein [Candidatus Dojkabacteria bacterium]